MHLQGATLVALHGATEAYLVQLFEDSNECAVNMKCETKIPKTSRESKTLGVE